MRETVLLLAQWGKRCGWENLWIQEAGSRAELQYLKLLPQEPKKKKKAQGTAHCPRGTI